MPSSTNDYETIPELVQGCIQLHDEITFINPTVEQLQCIVNITSMPLTESPNTLLSTDAASETGITVFADKDTIMQAQTEFTTASKLTQLVEDDEIELRVVNIDMSSVVRVDEELLNVISLEDDVIITKTTDNEDIAAVSSAVNTKASNKPPELLQPGIRSVYEQLQEEVGGEFADSFTEMIEVVSQHDEAPAIAELFVGLAAYENELQQDVSRVLEDSNVISQATFSRSKTALEEDNIIQKESVIQDIGRPQHRLAFTDPAATEVETPSDIVSTVNKSF